MATVQRMEIYGNVGLRYSFCMYNPFEQRPQAPVNPKFRRDVMQEKKFHDVLLSVQDKSKPFPLSKNLAINPDIENVTDAADDLKKLYIPYHAQLEEYNFGEASDPQKRDFYINKKFIPNWKFHLNVPVAHVKQVSHFLKTSGYWHKFLKGGEPQDGKTFTVYIGSKDLADAAAQDISRSIGALLARPKDVTEIEFAPGVIGRFDTRGDNEFPQYSAVLRGFPELNEDKMNFFALRHMIKNNEPGALEKYKKATGEAFEFAYARLSEKYGTYFYGTK